MQTLIRKAVPKVVRNVVEYYWLVVKHAARDTLGLASRQGVMVGALLAILAGVLATSNPTKHLGQVVVPTIASGLIFCGVWFALQLCVAPARIWSDQAGRLAVFDAPAEIDLVAGHQLRGGNRVLTLRVHLRGRENLHAALVNVVAPLGLTRFEPCNQNGVPTGLLNAEHLVSPENQRWILSERKLTGGTQTFLHFIVEYPPETAGEKAELLITHPALPLGTWAASIDLPAPNELPPEDAPYVI